MQTVDLHCHTDVKCHKEADKQLSLGSGYRALPLALTFALPFALTFAVPFAFDTHMPWKGGMCLGFMIWGRLSF